MENKDIEEILEDVKRHLDYVNDSGLKSIRDIEMEKMYYYILDLQNNRDKAIEYLKEKADYPISYYHCIRETIDILKGDSDDTR